MLEEVILRLVLQTMGFDWLLHASSSCNSVLSRYPNVEGYSGIGQGCHHLPATSQSVGVSDNYVARSRLDTTSTLYHTDPIPGQDYPYQPGVLS